MNYSIYQVDAFAKNVFEGNPAAVIPLVQWLPDHIMQQIAQENNLAETAFIVPTENGFHIRWMTPTVEVLLCGHATLATAHVLFHHQNYSKDKIEFQSKSGILTVSKDGDKYVLDFPTDTPVKVDPIDIFSKGLGVEPIECFKGTEDYMVIFENEAVIKNLNPDFRIMSSLSSRGTIATAPGDEVDFVSRCFFPQSGIDEDPVTGSAHTLMIPYWSNKLNKSELVAKQISKRSGYLFCKHNGHRVSIAGHAKTYMIGEINVEI